MLFKKLTLAVITLPIFIGGLSSATPTEQPIAAMAGSTKILADTVFLKSLGIKPLMTDSELELSVAEVSDYQADNIAHAAHKFGKCGGFERLQSDSNIGESFNLMRLKKAQAQAYESIASPAINTEKNPNIEAATQQVSIDNLKANVQWLSSYPNRFYKNTKSTHVDDLAVRIKQMLEGISYSYQVEIITHNQIKQKSLKVRLEGKDRPQEIVVLGGHLDSITGFGGGGNAPGADDNASGSSNILEALRILASQPQPSRTIEFFWYAGEEGGLIGSSEIAQAYKKSAQNVVGVMQLDMTLFPGEGELVIGDITDFTNPWLRNYLKTLNTYYVGAQWKEDKCGYGCSDHASWHRQGYATVMPFEAGVKTMNKNIHTAQDTVTPQLSFPHSVAFTKLAVAFAMDLGNSQLKPSF